MSDRDQREPSQTQEVSLNPFEAEVLSDFAPPYVAINTQEEIVFASASASPFVDTGQVDDDPRQFVTEIQPTVDRLMQAVAETNTTAKEDFSGEVAGKGVSCTVACKPVETSGCILVFDDVTIADATHAASQGGEQPSAEKTRNVTDAFVASPMPMAVLDTEGYITCGSAGLAEIFGNDYDGQSIKDVVPDHGDDIGSAIGQVIDKGQQVTGVRIKISDGKVAAKERTFETDWYPVRQDDGSPGIGVSFRDISDLLQASADLSHMTQELQHRVKNMLANVLALVSRAGRDAQTEKEIFLTLSERIYALSQAHKLLTQSNWKKAGLFDVLESPLVDRYGRHRISLAAEDRSVNPRAALALSMAVHELATNAARHGCLARANGVVDMTWDAKTAASEDAVVFIWRESGGPPPDPDSVDGFGRQLIQSAIEGSLAGTTEFSWEPNGLVCVFKIPETTLVEIDDVTSH